MTEVRTATLAVAAGEGLLARRHRSVLFIPTPGEQSRSLIEAFVDAADDESVFDAVAQAVIEAEFAVDPFVCISFIGVVGIRVFGEIEIRTDLPSVPMLSGAGSGTWVEHSAPGSTGSIDAILTSGIDVAKGHTNLESGLVPAGGFALQLIGADRIAVADATDVEPIAEVAIVQEVVVESDDRVALALDALGPAPEPEPVVEIMVDTEPDEDRTLMPVEPSDSPPPPGPSVLARCCPSGHPNRPSRVTCSICDSFLTPGDDGVSLVQRPSVGTLVFDDGSKYDLTKPLVIGRAPKEPSEGEAKTILALDSDRISRTHLEVSIVDWDVMVIDRKSRNGTVVVPADGAQPVKVDPSTPQLLEPGAVVYFGTRSVTLRPPSHGAALETSSS